MKRAVTMEHKARNEWWISWRGKYLIQYRRECCVFCLNYQRPDKMKNCNEIKPWMQAFNETAIKLLQLPLFHTIPLFYCWRKLRLEEARKTIWQTNRLWNIIKISCEAWIMCFYVVYREHPKRWTMAKCFELIQCEKATRQK